MTLDDALAAIKCAGGTDVEFRVMEFKHGAPLGVLVKFYRGGGLEMRRNAVRVPEGVKVGDALPELTKWALEELAA